MMGRRKERRHVFIMGNVTLSFLGVTWCAVTTTSLAVGYIYLSCSHLYSFASYDRPYALKIKYPVTRGYQFLLDVQVFACCYMKGLARLQNHCYTSIV